ncbi:hypothetical protein S101258_02818 [Lactiplantibacillus plantarum subsp. plantarum]|uniref:Uncharacterized protein n=1 Tax=Lactiplantibacillus plantarum subsp. plantarum TaxID=337330 RepID=A0A2S3U2H9_LACPN|nr:hypothetical protein S101258_02818 [Lactiplantibacillus plantarum subsp. plantarum]
MTLEFEPVQLRAYFVLWHTRRGWSRLRNGRTNGARRRHYGFQYRDKGASQLTAGPNG